MVSKEISGLRNSLKQSSVSSQIKNLTLSTGEGEEEQSEGFVSPEVEYLERFSKYLDFKRNDIIRLSSRTPGKTNNLSAKEST